MNKNKLYASLIFIVLGMTGTWESLHYEIGALASMGPGYYPLALSIILVALGALNLFIPDAVLSDEDAVPLKAYIRPWSCVLSGCIAFLMLGRWGGLIPAVAVLVFVSALGDTTNSVRDAFLLALGAVIFTVLVFHYGMKLQFPLWQWG